MNYIWKYTNEHIIWLSLKHELCFQLYMKSTLLSPNGKLRCHCRKHKRVIIIKHCYLEHLSTTFHTREKHFKSNVLQYSTDCSGSVVYLLNISPVKFCSRSSAGYFSGFISQGGNNNKKRQKHQKQKKTAQLCVSFHLCVCAVIGRQRGGTNPGTLCFKKPSASFQFHLLFPLLLHTPQETRHNTSAAFTHAINDASP